MPDGSRSVNAFSAYTAASRQKYRVSIVVNEAAERRQIHRRRMLGNVEPIREADVIRNLADNLSRQPEKTTATDLLSRAGQVYRGTVRNLQAGVEPFERARWIDRPTFHRMHEHHLAERSPVLRRLVEHARELRQRVIDRYIARGYRSSTHSLRRPSGTSSGEREAQRAYWFSFGHRNLLLQGIWHQTEHQQATNHNAYNSEITG